VNFGYVDLGILELLAFRLNFCSRGKEPVTRLVEVVHLLLDTEVDVLEGVNWHGHISEISVACLFISNYFLTLGGCLHVGMLGLPEAVEHTTTTIVIVPISQHSPSEGA